MKVANSTVLITGANRGIGFAFAKAFLERGARKLYADARDPSRISLPGVTPVQLDVNSRANVQAAAQLASDATIVVNKAGITKIGNFLADDTTQPIKHWLSAERAVYLAAR